MIIFTGMKKGLGLLAWILWIPFGGYAWTWAPVLPYTQTSREQHIVVKAIPYSPFEGTVALGCTEVYKHNKLLYTIDRYFDDVVRTSDDGSIFIAIRTYEVGNIIHWIAADGRSGQEIDFDKEVAWVYRYGKPAKTFTLRQMVDSVTLVSRGEYRNWGYEYDFSSEYRLKKESEVCLDRINHMASRCHTVKDSLRFFEKESDVHLHRIFVEKGAVHIYTKIATLVSIHFPDLMVSVSNIDSVQAAKILPQKNIPRKSYWYPLYPDEFASPQLKNGQPLDEAIAAFLGLKVAESHQTENYMVYFGELLIGKDGVCRFVSVNVYGTGRSVSGLGRGIDPQMTEQLEQWLSTLVFDAKDIPEGFDAYSFRPILYFE